MVADGHGGVDSASHCHEHALTYAIRAAGLDASSSSLRAACVAAFERLHREVRAMRDCTSGSTLTIVALNSARSELTAANIGDTLAYVVCAR